MCMNKLNSSTMSKVWHKVNFLAKYSWFEIRVKAREPNLPYYLPIAGWEEGKMDFMLFTKALSDEMQNAKFKIWTQIAKSISDKNNRYTKMNTFLFYYQVQWFFIAPYLGVHIKKKFGDYGSSSASCSSLST